jgi:hypothetical protein
MSIYRFTAPVMLVMLFTVPAAHAAPIFTQNARDTGFPSELEFDTLTADDFSIAVNETVRSVSWQGAYAFDGTAPAVDDFEIRVYDNDAGSPGALLQTFAPGNAVARTAVGLLGTLTEYSYTADLGAGFAVSAGTTYWLMIGNDTTGDNDNWYWSVQTGGGNVHISLDDGLSWGVTTPRAAAYFTLDNANVVVPEPASLLLVGMGVAAAVRRRLQQL